MANTRKEAVTFYVSGALRIALILIAFAFVALACSLVIMQISALLTSFSGPEGSWNSTPLEGWANEPSHIRTKAIYLGLAWIPTAWFGAVIFERVIFTPNCTVEVDAEVIERRVSFVFREPVVEIWSTSQIVNISSREDRKLLRYWSVVLHLKGGQEVILPRQATKSKSEALIERIKFILDYAEIGQ